MYFYTNPMTYVHCHKKEKVKKGKRKWSVLRFLLERPYPRKKLICWCKLPTFFCMSIEMYNILTEMEL